MRYLLLYPGINSELEYELIKEKLIQEDLLRERMESPLVFENACPEQSLINDVKSYSKRKKLGFPSLERVYALFFK